MFKDRKVPSEGPIFIFDLIMRIVEEDTLEISEGQLMVLLPHV